MTALIRGARIAGLCLLWAGIGMLLGAALMSSVSAQEPAANAEPLPTLEEVEIRDTTEIAWITRVEDYLNGLRSLRAEFIQYGADGTAQRGMVSLARPGRVRFEYGEEVPILIVADGNQITLVDYEVPQVTRWPVMDTPLRLLLADTIHLDSDVELIDSGPGSLANLLAVTVRDPERPDQGSMTLIFEKRFDENDAPRVALTSWEVIDAQGTLTTVLLSNVETNLALEASLWEFEDPRNLPSQQRRRNRR